MDLDLKNDLVVIIGGAGLIGRSFVKAVAESGALTVIADVNLEAADKVKKDLLKENESLKVDVGTVDIISRDSIEEFIQTIFKKYKKIDSVVNCAYPRNKNWGRKFEEVTYQDFCDNVNLHLGGYFLVSQRFSEYFKKQGNGNIINVASIQGVMAPKFDTYTRIVVNGKEMTSPVEYAAIKAALIHMTKYMAKYFKGMNIRCNCISPGGILDGQPEEFTKRYKNYCTSKGMLDPSDLSGALIFLLSKHSQYINGQNLIVDDGWTL